MFYAMKLISPNETKRGNDEKKSFEFNFAIIALIFFCSALSS